MARESLANCVQYTAAMASTMLGTPGPRTPATATARTKLGKAWKAVTTLSTT